MGSAGALAEQLRTRARLAAEYLACGHQTHRLLGQRSLLQSARLQFLLALIAGLQSPSYERKLSASAGRGEPEPNGAADADADADAGAGAGAESARDEDEADAEAAPGNEAPLPLASIGFERSALAPDTRLLLAHLDAETVALLVAQLRADLLHVQESMKLTRFFDLCNAAVRFSST